ncbi:MAG: gliding motility-associated C-terminal domain-containing protein [Flavobacteriales bacterium]|nr:gliding motility-associated C-terminal domain-containing protein [Flavobacteriales bacterium]
MGTGVFAAALSCATPCNPPVASATMGQAIPALVCQGEVITFDGSASTAAGGATLAEYRWDFQDGTQDSLTGPIVTHSFAEAGEYVVQLILTDDNECNNNNLVDLQIFVSTTPTFAGTLPGDTICEGESVNLLASPTAVTWSALPENNLGGGIFLPDDQGVPFTSTLIFTNFSPGQTLTNINDLLSVCVSMEHSFMGDLVISLACPSGQSVTFHQQNGGGTYLGEPVDIETLPDSIGVCYNYCWSPSATNGTWVDNAQATLPAGTYESLNPMDALVGCELNGTWSFTITDLWAIDNGFLCDWSMNFDQSLFPSLTTFTPVLGTTTADSSNWVGNGVSSDPNNPLAGVATPVGVGSHDYVFSVTDNFGCTYDTTITIVVNPGITGPIILTGDQLVCDGGIAFINAPAGYDTYEWNNGAFGPNISGGPGTYICTISLGDCSLPSEPFVVTGAPSPDPVITGPGFSCGGGQAVLGTTENYASYQWSNASTDPTITVGTGSYSVTVTNAEGCSTTSAPFTVTVGSNVNAAYLTNLPSPQPFGATIIFSDNSSVDGSTIVNWQWIFDPVNGGSTQPNTTNLYETPGTYPVTLIVTAADGCTDTINGSFRILPADIEIPNVFTPNGDEWNQNLVFENVQYYKNNLTIFNRWGNKVYEKENYANNWQASDVPDGTYFYVLSVPEANKEYTGHVTILR